LTKVVITVIGRDRVGIIHEVSGVLAQKGINILDINQTIMQDIFTMIMVADISGSASTFAEAQDALNAKADELGVSIRMQHSGIFDSMHRL